MNENQVKLEDMTATALQDIPEITRPVIENMIRKIAPVVQVYNEEDIEESIKRLEERFDINMSVGTLFSAEDYRPWLDEQRGEIEWYYWNRYKRLLAKKRFPREVINAIHADTDRILDHLENPVKEGAWARKGLVVGHVQSGKTANYTGLICKAADAGYRLIIVLAGMSNSLRNQTQERIDEGFVGIETSKLGDNLPLKNILKGVGELNSDRLPNSFTTRKRDFDRQFAQTRGSIANSEHPFILVIKKNTNSFSNLIAWLKNNNLHLDKFPFLLIDDEADHASINTNKPELDPTAINSKLTELLSLFIKNTYVGYTATPFANVFIDPGPNDIFPEDFIYSLNTPDNYIGSEKIFGPNSDLNVVREIYDYEDYIPLKHKKNLNPTEIPPSLKEAIIVFILVCTGRILRGQVNKHNSMLINVSVLKDVHRPIKLLVLEYLDDLREAIRNHYALPEHESIKNPFIKLIKSIWIKEFSKLEFDWKVFQGCLKAAVSPISVIEVNTSKTGEPISYEEELYPSGRNVIAVGGYSLSRGLTLEGLTVSYFLRNTKMYDTLMQMGRWFGYRDGYADLCRIYMPPESISWYRHISDVTEELRSEFKRMEIAQMTPKDFGLCVRSHPESLIVTARNKMRTGKKVPRQISLYGRQIETSVLSASKQNVIGNWKSLEILISNVTKDAEYKRDKSNHLFRKVPVVFVKEFIDSYENHPASYLTESSPVLDYIDNISNNGATKWDVLLVNSSSVKESNIVQVINGYSIRALYRTVSDEISGAVSSDKRRFGSGSWEKAGLSEEQIKLAKLKYPELKTIPGKAYRSVRNIPLLMLYILDCRKYGGDTPLFDKGVVAWGISFPGLSGSRRPEKLVEYVVNTTWWNNEYGGSVDDEDVIDE